MTNNFKSISRVIRINVISLLGLSQLHAFEIANCNNGRLENEDIQRPLRPQNLKTKTPRILYTGILLYTCTLLENKFLNNKTTFEMIFKLSVKVWGLEGLSGSSV